MSFKKVGLGLQNPVTYSEKNLGLQRARTELIQAVARESKLSTADHLQALREERHNRQKFEMMPMKPNLGG